MLNPGWRSLHLSATVEKHARLTSRKGYLTVVRCFTICAQYINLVTPPPTKSYRLLILNLSMASLPAIDSLLVDLLCVVVLIHCHFLAKLIFKECLKDLSKRFLSRRKPDRKQLHWKKIGVLTGLLCAILFVEETFIMCSCRALFDP
jgi:hypothetical protein